MGFWNPVDLSVYMNKNYVGTGHEFCIYFHRTKHKN
jgi:hypothetical protein